MTPLHRRRHRWSRVDTVIVLVGLAILAGAALPLPGYSVEPGQARDVRYLIVIEDHRVFRPAGSFLVSTVALRPLSPFLALRAWLDDDIRTVPKHRVQGKRARTAALEESEAVAVAVAIDRLGFPVQRTGGGALIEKVDRDSPALPLKVRIDAGEIEGPSAGLAFTLAVLDLLTPGELTGKNRIAVTGAIDIHGNVGKVGRVTEKAVAARRAGARFFLVPSGQAEEASRGGRPKVKVVSVSTLDDALTALEALGGDAIVVKRNSAARLQPVGEHR